MNEWKLESLPKTSKECVELLGSNFIGDFFKKKKTKKKERTLVLFKRSYDFILILSLVIPHRRSLLVHLRGHRNPAWHPMYLDQQTYFPCY